MGRCPDKRSPGVWLCALCRGGRRQARHSGAFCDAVRWEKRAAELGPRVPTGIRGRGRNFMVSHSTTSLMSQPNTCQMGSFLSAAILHNVRDWHLRPLLKIRKREATLMNCCRFLSYDEAKNPDHRAVGST